MNRTAQAESAPVTEPRRVRRRFGARRWVLIGAGALVAVAALADTIAAGVTESDLADRVARRQSALTGAPDVSVDGFP
ncbi:hypothetical protein ACFXPJ_42180, partial [Streptomyces goshikiensis]